MDVKNEKILSIGKNIKYYRKELGITQKELAERIGKSTITVRKYESDDIIVPIDVLYKIAKALETPPILFMNNEIGGDESEYKSERSLADYPGFNEHIQELQKNKDQFITFVTGNKATQETISKYIFNKGLSEDYLLKNVDDDDKEIISVLYDRDIIQNINSLILNPHIEVSYIRNLNDIDNLPKEALDEINEYIEFIKHKFQAKE
ncbi:helix-turn-helix transcriptional regulator [Clostridioides mangenotii]|uniref:helix-turn-helix domain-containing protein n=1 Tax=Metaclostridioides mangenotii TaxID=1540 RepID=UPI001C101B51|nr:helix-turn-helix transcriptional regulator [Clostridioides mangenotii]MBU5308525.1 helix-turn-helix transcriptional regulator [Clostridioides mangenotii]